MTAINNTPKLHITQDDYGFWMLSVEHTDGSLQLLAYHFPKPAHLTEDAQELIAKGIYPGAVMMQDEPRPDVATNLDTELPEYQVPAPKKAGE